METKETGLSWDTAEWKAQAQECDGVKYYILTQHDSAGFNTLQKVKSSDYEWLKICMHEGCRAGLVEDPCMIRGAVSLEWRGSVRKASCYQSAPISQATKRHKPTNQFTSLPLISTNQPASSDIVILLIMMYRLTFFTQVKNWPQCCVQGTQLSFLFTGVTIIMLGFFGILLHKIAWMIHQK